MNGLDPRDLGGVAELIGYVATILLMLLLAGLSNPLAPAFGLWLSVAAAIYMAWLALCSLGASMRAAGSLCCTRWSRCYRPGTTRWRA